MSNLFFYLRQAVSNSLRNRQRTIFVLFCIAVGVAAVVSLRSVGLMIGVGLTRDLQADLRGDLVITPPIIDERFGDSEVDRALVEEGADIGSTTFSELGIERLTAWVEERGGRLQLGARKQKPMSVYPASAAAGDDAPADPGAPASAITFFVQPESYPFYKSLQMVDPPDLPLAEAFAGPHHVVIGQRLAAALEVSVGDRLQVRGPEPFVVGGILADSADARLREIEGVILPFLLLPYDTGAQELGVLADTIYVQLGEEGRAPAAVTAVAEELGNAFPGLNVTTTEDLREENQDLSFRLTQLITTMGLLSLLIGGIGIINTMLVVVGRRTLEISVLKTLGLQGRQITVMFLVEALLLGVVGSLFGVVLGVALLGVLQGVAERVFVQTLRFELFPEALVMGFVMGVIVTLVFGFLPTLAAGKVRPAVVLQPDRVGLPKAGKALSALVVLLLTAVIGLLVGQILGRFGVGIAVALVAMAGLGLLTLIFRGLVVVLARLPSFGRISIQLTQRALAGHSGRVASTLLALVVGMFALSSILLMTQTLLNLIETVMESRLGGEVVAVARSPEAGRQLAQAIDGLEGLEGVEHQIVYRAKVVAINGDRDIEALEEAAYQEAERKEEGKEGEERSQSESGAGPGAESGAGPRGAESSDVQEAEAAAQGDQRLDGRRFVLRDFLGEFSLTRQGDLQDVEEDRYQIGEGSDLIDRTGKAEDDAAGGGEAEIVLRPGRAAEWLGLEVGDTLTLAFPAQAANPASTSAPPQGEEPKAVQPDAETPRIERPIERTVTIVGQVAKPPEKKLDINTRERTQAIAGAGVVPEGALPGSTPYILDLEDDRIQPALRELSAIPGVFAVEVALINTILTSLFAKLTALPLVVAILALFAAGVIIANSVSLAVLERRRQIGIMKAVGLQSSQVLRLLLLENGFVGLAGGLIGCGIGVVGLLLLGVFSEVPESFPWLTLVALVALSVAIALAATLLTAWGASRERPLIVLRYE